MRIPWNKESYIPGAGVYAFSQEAAEAWAWAFDSDDDAQMKPSISRGLGQDLGKHLVRKRTQSSSLFLMPVVSKAETCWQLLLTMLYADCSICNTAPSSVPAQVKTTGFNTSHVLIITTQHRGQPELVQTTSRCRRHSTEELLTS